MITIENFLKANVGEEYTKVKVKKLFGKRETLTPEDISKLNIPLDDRLWVLVHLFLNDEQCKQFAILCLERINETIPETNCAKLLAMNAAEKAAWTLAKLAIWPKDESPLVSFRTRENRAPLFDEARRLEREWQIELAVWCVRQNG